MARSWNATRNAGTTLFCGLILAMPAAGQCDPDATFTDCNNNGLADACEVLGLATLTSGAMSPFDVSNPQSFVLDAPPVAMEDLILTVTAKGDLQHWTETVELWLNDTPVKLMFVFSTDCTEVSESVLISRDMYNAAAAAGTVAFHLVPSAAVNTSQCGDASFVDAKLELVTAAAMDENANGVPDECEVDDSTLCDGMEPNIYVDDEGMIVGGPLDGVPYFGLLVGTKGADVMRGTDGRDIMLGLKGDDVMCGGNGDDRMFGHKGNDVLLAGANEDRAFGGHGNDLIDAGDGRDMVHGGQGRDTSIDGEKVRGCEG